MVSRSPKNVDASTIKVMLEIWYRSVRMMADFFNLAESFAYKTSTKKRIRMNAQKQYFSFEWAHV